MACAVSHGSDEIIDDQVVELEFVKKMQEPSITAKALVLNELPDMDNKAFHLPVASGAIEASPDEIYRLCHPAVVVFGSIRKCEKCPKWHPNLATAWIASPDGHVVTNYHVIDQKKAQFGIMTANGEVYPVVEICALDKVGDVAVLKVDTRGEKLPFLRLGSEVKPGDEISIISHPSFHFWYLSKGVVARFSRHSGEEGSPTWMNVTADYGVGSSGGPVLDRKGSVVGMVSSTETIHSQVIDKGEDTEMGVIKMGPFDFRFLLSDNGKNTLKGDTQMVVKHCVPLPVLEKALSKK